MMGCTIDHSWHTDLAFLHGRASPGYASYACYGIQENASVSDTRNGLLAGQFRDKLANP